MKYLLAPDSFKESMSAFEACKAMAKGIKKVDPQAEIDICPLADGGEGTAEILNQALNTEIKKVSVLNQKEIEVEASLGFDVASQTAIIEAASAVAIDFVEVDNRNPLEYTSYGLGQLINYAIDSKAKKIICALGGSGTNDGGLGMLLALGLKCFDKAGLEFKPKISEINNCVRLDFAQVLERVSNIEIQVASDVSNPYLGSNGATYVFAKQKGASSEDIIILESCLNHLNNLFIESLGIDLANIKCSGAAGGIAGALHLINGELVSGIDLVLDKVNFDERLKGIDYIFTGEGSIDSQTVNGKTISGLARRAKKANVPVIAFAGRVYGDLTPLYEIGVKSIFSITLAAMSLEQALKEGSNSMSETVMNVVKLITK